jgi:hypothetical protein
MTEKDAVVKENRVVADIGTTDALQNFWKYMLMKQNVLFLKFLFQTYDTTQANLAFVAHMFTHFGIYKTKQFELQKLDVGISSVL